MLLQMGIEANLGALYALLSPKQLKFITQILTSFILPCESHKFEFHYIRCFSGTDWSFSSFLCLCLTISVPLSSSILSVSSLVLHSLWPPTVWWLTVSLSLIPCSFLLFCISQ